MDVDDAVDVPTLSGVGANGTGYFSADVEIFDGALCVGDGATDNCSDAGAVDGIIYSVASSVTQHDIAEAFPSTEFLLAGKLSRCRAIAMSMSGARRKTTRLLAQFQHRRD